MKENIIGQLLRLPDLLGGHLLLSVSAMLIGLTISLPLGILAARSLRLKNPVLAAASLIQTVPSMALLALMVPLLGGTIGFLPAFIALTLYSILPTLRNTVTGIAEVDPAIVEAARGVGMSDRQRLLQVELPLALPVIIAGIRTSTVWVVGTATLSTPVGAPSLGNYIFAGLQTRNWVSVLFGCVFAALLAIILDSLIHLMEVAVRRRSRSLALTAALALLAVFVGGTAPVLSDRAQAAHLIPLQLDSKEEQSHASEEPPLAGRRLIVGSKTFTEQYILAGLLQRHLERHGAFVSRIENMGSTILFDALRNNTVDVYVDYTGTIWATLMRQTTPLERTATFIEVAKYLRDEYGVLAVGRLGFENAYCLAMRRDQTVERGIRSIADLGRYTSSLTIGADPEFFGRPEWVSVRETYGLHEARTQGMDSTFMYGAVRDGAVDVISAYTTDGRISAYDLAILRDPQDAFPPYDAILLLSPKAKEIPELVSVLTTLVNQIDDHLMREANRQVDIEGLSSQQATDHLYSVAVE